jgi:hypothetical protein
VTRAFGGLGDSPPLCWSQNGHKKLRSGILDAAIEVADELRRSRKLAVKASRDHPIHFWSSPRRGGWSSRSPASTRPWSTAI